MEDAKVELAGLPLTQYRLDENKSIFDMTLMMAETNNGIAAKLVYNSDLFEKRFIRRFMNHFSKLIDIVVDNPNVQIFNIALVDEKTSEPKLDINLNSPSLDSHFVHRGFEKHAQLNANKTAVEFKNKALTYSELNSKANKISNYLLNKDLQTETRIGVFVERSFEMIQSILAILKAGYVYVPIDTTYPNERILKIIDDAEINIILSQEKFSDYFKSSDLEVVCIDNPSTKIDEFSSKNPDRVIDPLNLAYSIYTSGSTGNPKGVMLSHSGLSNLIDNQTRIFNISEESRILQLASLSFDASVSEIFTSLTNGATLHLVSHEVLLSGGALINELNKSKISIATIPPSLLAVIPYDKLAALKTLVSAGEQCTNEVVQKWSNGRKFINAYGPTEVTVCATTFDIENSIHIDNIPIGTSIGGTNVFIFDEDLNLVPKGVPGELHVSGVGLARGYNNSPDQTAQKFIPNPYASLRGDRLYKTGDLVKLREDGNIEFLGRIDNQVKFRGYRIELKEIQTILENNENIHKAELLLKNVKPNEKKLVAFYVSKNKKKLSSMELREYLTSYLPEYMIPSTFVSIDSIPLTSNGKVNKRALEKIKFNGDLQKMFENPQSEFEKNVLGIWKEVLDIDKISRNDNFFDLGGHSLNVIQVQTKLKETYSIELTIVDFFKYPTIKLIAKYLSSGSDIEQKVEETKMRIGKQKSVLAQQQARMKGRRKFN